MSPVFRFRRRAEEFDALLEGPALPGAPPEAVGHGDQARLLELVVDLRTQSVVGPTPRPAFTAGLRDRLMAEAATGLPGREVAPLVPAHPRSGRERRLVAAATVSIVLGGTAGMASAAEGALPGQALYPIKRGIEQAQVDLAGSAFARGRQLLENASTRLDEVQGLLNSGPVARATQIPHTLQDFSRQAGEGADLMLRSYRSTGNPDTVATVREFAATQLHTLTHFAEVASPKAHQDLEVAATTLGDIDGSARVACVDCGNDIPPLTVPGTLKHHSREPVTLHLAGASSVTTTVGVDVPPTRLGDDTVGIDLVDLAPPPGPAPLDAALPPAAPAPAVPAAADPAGAPPPADSATGDPGTSDPATSGPATSDPSTSDPATSDPATSDPATSDPATSDPATSDPATGDPAPTSEQPSTPASPDPPPAQVTPSPPDPSEPAPSTPGPDDVTPAVPAPSGQAPDAAPSASAPSGAASSARPGAGQDPAPGWAWAPSAPKSPQVPKTQ
jgi:Domain of unknown function (DUF5667)